MSLPECGDLLRGLAAHVDQRRVQPDIYSIGTQAGFQLPRQLGIVAWNQAVTFLNEGHLAAEPLKSLRHFDADRPSTDHQQRWRNGFQIENRLIGAEA